MFYNALYTYDDVEDDFDLEQFALSMEDNNLKVPILNTIKLINSEIELIGSLWSAPSWIKTTDLGNSGYIVKLDKYFTTLANYLAKYRECPQ